MRSLAIVKLSALGDIVHAMVALQFIKARYPALEIDWIVEERFAGLLEHNPEIRAILPLNLKQLRRSPSSLVGQWRLVKEYARREYDLVIDAQGLLKSALVSFFLGHRRAGFDRRSIREGVAALLYNQTVSIPYHANTIDRNVRVLTEPLGISVSPDEIRRKKPFLFFDALTVRSQVDEVLNKECPNVLYVIGSTWESRNYPVEQYAAVAEGLNAHAVILWGNPAEYRKAEQMAALLPGASIVPKLSMNELKYLIAKVDLVIGNDTGPTHMAWGLDRPSITLFGPTPLSRVYETNINKTLKSPSIVNPYRLNRNDYSIKEIPSEAVMALARELLGSTYHR